MIKREDLIDRIRYDPETGKLTRGNGFKQKVGYKDQTDILG